MNPEPGGEARPAGAVGDGSGGLVGPVPVSSTQLPGDDGGEEESLRGAEGKG